MSKKSLIDSIEVKSPCTESWDEMSGNDKFRFCSHCAKDVNNISEMTRKEAMRLVRHSGGNICVRYIVNPATRKPIFAANLVNIARRVPRLAGGVMTASIALASAAYAQTGDSAQPEVQIVNETRTETAGSSISGYVTDQNGALLPFALVTLSNADGYLIQAVNASAEGLYEFKDVAAGTYSLKIEAGGFTPTLLTSVSVSEASQVRRDAQLAVQSLDEVVQVGGGDTFTQVTISGGAIVCETSGPVNDLVEAVYDEDMDEITSLIAKGARVNSRDNNHDGVTALHAAVEVGNIEIVQILLNSGAKINGRDSLKRTPLMMMDTDATPELLQLLLRYGARIDLTDKKGTTALTHFAAFDDPEMIRLFVSAGANVNAADKKGQTPLMAAAGAGSLEVVKILLESGANANGAPKKNGQTAWNAAATPEIKTLLESYGAIIINR